MSAFVSLEQEVWRQSTPTVTKAGSAALFPSFYPTPVFLHVLAGILMAFPMVERCIPVACGDYASLFTFSAEGGKIHLVGQGEVRVHLCQQQLQNIVTH